MTEREAELESKLETALVENRLLREKVDALVRMIYGRKSERLDPRQLMLLMELEEKPPDAPVVSKPSAPVMKKASRAAARPRLPEHLPVKEVFLDPEEVKASPQAWRLMGEEVSEQLDYEPGRFWKRRLIRRKYVRKDTPFAPPLIAPLPPSLRERCLATPELITQVVISKYTDHLPLYRQEQIYRRRHGVFIPRQTLCRWVDYCADACQLVYAEMIRRQMAGACVQIDETPIRYLDPGHGATSQGYFWVSRTPDGTVVYHWQAGRSAQCLQRIVPEHFKGILQCDGYAAYPSLQRQRAGPGSGRIELAACWAHVRRKFYEAKERDPRVSAWALGQIAQLYRIESRLRESRAGPALRTAIRAAQSAPVVARLRKALIALRRRYLPASALGKAITYALGQWNALEVFLGNGCVAIDNNAVERAIRPSKLGAKNWLFIGAESSGKTSAILFSLIESAKAHGLEPHAYLLFLLRHLPLATNHQIPRFTPAALANNKSLQALPCAA